MNSQPSQEEPFEKSMRLLEELGVKIDLMNADTERRLSALEAYYDQRSAKIAK